MVISQFTWKKGIFQGESAESGRNCMENFVLSLQYLSVIPNFAHILDIVMLIQKL